MLPPRRSSAPPIPSRSGRGAQDVRPPPLRRARLRDVPRARVALGLDGPRAFLRLRPAPPRRARARRARSRGRYRAASHRVIAIPSFGALGGSALTDRSIRVPKKALGRTRIPVTYVPARNTLFLAFALGAAETSGATEIVIGANALDYSGYPDCRPAFLRAFERVANLGTKAGDEGRRFADPRAAPRALEGRHRPARARARPRSGPHDVLLRPRPFGKAVRRLRRVPPAREGLRGGGGGGSPDPLIQRGARRGALAGAGEEIPGRLLRRLKRDRSLERRDRRRRIAGEDQGAAEMVEGGKEVR